MGVGLGLAGGELDGGVGPGVGVAGGWDAGCVGGCEAGTLSVGSEKGKVAPGVSTIGAGVAPSPGVAAGAPRLGPSGIGVGAVVALPQPEMRNIAARAAHRRVRATGSLSVLRRRPVKRAARAGHSAKMEA